MKKSIFRLFNLAQRTKNMRTAGLLIATGALALVGCKKSDFQQELYNPEKGFTVSVRVPLEESSTKLALEDQGGRWSASWHLDDSLGGWSPAYGTSVQPVNIEKFTVVEQGANYDKSALFEGIGFGDELRLMYPFKPTIGSVSNNSYPVDLGLQNVVVNDRLGSLGSTVPMISSESFSISPLEGEITASPMQQVGAIADLHITFNEIGGFPEQFNLTKVSVRGFQSAANLDLTKSVEDELFYNMNSSNNFIDVSVSGGKGLIGEGYTAKIPVSILPTTLKAGSNIELILYFFKKESDGSLLYYSLFTKKTIDNDVTLERASLNTINFEVYMANAVLAPLLNIGSGTKEDPYLIASKEDLESHRDRINSTGDNEIKYYQLVDNIDLEGSDDNQWTPIGAGEHPFTGHFNGDGYTISGLRINAAEPDPGYDFPDYALFGSAKGATIINLGVQGSVSASFAGSTSAGLVANDKGSSITNCWSDVTINSQDGLAAGLIGNALNSKILNCYTLGDVNGNIASGIAGIATKTTIDNSYSAGNITGPLDFPSSGGIIGTVRFGETYEPTNCYSLENPKLIGGYNGEQLSEEDMKNNFSVLISNARWANANNPSTKYSSWTTTTDGFPRHDYGAVPQRVDLSEYFKGSGLEEDPYLIEDFHDLEALRVVVKEHKDLRGVHFMMTKDISFEGSTSEHIWEPIGDTGAPFNGIFDGNLKEIIEIQNTQGGMDYLGVFGVIENATVRNLTVSGTLKGVDYIGGIAGEAINSTISNCHNKVSITISHYFAGGIVGGAKNSTIINCENDGTVDISSQTPSSGLGSIIGGIVGHTDNTIVANCVNHGSIRGVNFIGGIVGSNSSDGKINNCINYTSGASITGDSDFGQIIGENTGLFFNCYSLTGGAAANGLGTNGTEMSAAEMASKDFEQKLNDGASLYNATSLKGEQAFEWILNSGEEHPTFNTNGTPAKPLGSFKGSGTELNPYQITNKDDLALLATLNNAGVDYTDTYFELTGPIDLGGEASPWTPIGTEKSRFAGNFNGKTYDITGLYINNLEDEDQGLFGYISNESNIWNLSVSGSVKAFNYVGGLVAYNYGTITNCSSTVEVEGTDYIGVLVGANIGTIANCFSGGDGALGTMFIGGLAGSNNSGVISASYSISPVKGDSHYGAVAGISNTYGGIILNSYSLVTLQNDARGRKGHTKTLEEMQDISFAETLTTAARAHNTMYADAKVKAAQWTSTGSDYPTLDFGNPAPVITFEGEGTQDNPYRINNKEDLMGLATLTNAGSQDANIYFSLMDNIDLGGSDSNQWIPIGFDASFSGHFNGNGKEITGLYINNPESNYQGLFYNISSEASISNLSVDGYVKGLDIVGGLVGVSDGTITNCSSTVEVEGDENIGVLVGQNNGTIANCFSGGVGASGTMFMGGLAGSNEGSIRSSYSTSSVSGSNDYGAVAGANTGNIIDCYSLSTIKLNGYGVSGIQMSETYMKTSSFASTLTAAARVYNTDYPDAGVKALSWVSTSNAYPTYDFEAPIPPTIGFSEGDGTVDNPYLIKTRDELESLAILTNSDQEYSANKYFKLNDNISLGGAAHPWTPIGTENNPFAGNFDGNGKTITGLYINNSMADNQGLFGFTSEASNIWNLSVDGSVAGAQHVGGLVGANLGTITNCSSTVQVEGTETIGVLIGANIGTIANCFSGGEGASGDKLIGGLAGYNDGTISASYSTATVNGESSYGGVTGRNFGSIENSYSLSSITFNGEGESGTQMSEAEMKSAGFASTLTTAARSYNTKYTDAKVKAVQWTSTGSDYPTLDFDNPAPVITFEGEGTQDNPYRINNKEDLMGLAALTNSGNNYENAYFSLMDNIYLGGEAHPWTPIGAMENEFAGNFNGKGYAITGLYIDNSNDFQGLFGITSGASSIWNLSVDGSVTGGNIVGGLVSGNQGTITNCSSTVKVEGSNYIGVLVGQNIGTIANCFTSGEGASGIGGTGGLAGVNNGTIRASYSTATVSGDSDYGGVTGYNEGNIIDCYSLSTIELNGNGISGTTKTLAEMQTPAFAETLTSNAILYNLSNPSLAVKALRWKGEEGAYPVIDFDSPAPETAFTGEGTANNPYKITSRSDLERLSTLTNSDADFTTGKYFELTQTIDLGGSSNNWTPIGTYSFFGHFNGKGNKITGLYINNPESEYQGLFGYTGEASSISNLSVAGFVSCKSAIGGLVAANEGTITNCSSTVEINGDYRLGVLVGENLGTIANCFSGGIASGIANIGGLAGNNRGTIRSSYSISAVSGDSDYGGVTGYNEGTITSCYSTTSPIGTGVSGIQKSEADMQTPAFAETLTSNAILYNLSNPSPAVKALRWKGEEGAYPVIDFDSPAPETAFTGEGTANNPYKITSKSDLERLSTLANSDADFTTGKYFELTQTIDLGGSSNNWTPIGVGYYFSGSFDGKGNKITGLYINNPESDYQGLFGITSTEASICNLSVAGFVSCKSAIGGLVAISNGTITNCSSTVEINGDYRLGVLVGENLGTIANCFSGGIASGIANIGGLAGENSGTIRSSYSISAVSGSSHFGGVAGLNFNSGTITACYSLSTLSPNGTGVSGIQKSEADMQTIDFATDLTTAASAYNTENPTAIQAVQWQGSVGAYPALDFVNPAPAFAFTGSGTQASPYQIGSKEDLELLATLVNSGAAFAGKHFKLTDNIDLIGGYGNNWTPIGNINFSFDGYFDGGGKEISNLYINLGNASGAAYDYQALFGKVGKGAYIANLAVSGSVSASNVFYVAAIAAFNDGTIINCIANARIEGSEVVGGIVGYNDNGKVINCANIYTHDLYTGVSGNNRIGGLIGQIIHFNQTVFNSYNIATVDASSNHSDSGGIYGSFTIAGGNPSSWRCYSANTEATGAGWNGDVDEVSGNVFTQRDMEVDSFTTLLNEGVNEYNAGDGASALFKARPWKTVTDATPTIDFEAAIP